MLGPPESMQWLGRGLPVAMASVAGEEPMDPRGKPWGLVSQGLEDWYQR